MELLMMTTKELEQAKEDYFKRGGKVTFLPSIKDPSEFLNPCRGGDDILDMPNYEIEVEDYADDQTED